MFSFSLRMNARSANIRAKSNMERAAKEEVSLPTVLLGPPTESIPFYLGPLTTVLSSSYCVFVGSRV